MALSNDLEELAGRADLYPHAALPASARTTVLACALAALLALAPGAAARQISKPTWLSGTTITEYYPVPEAWFSGALVKAPGLAGKHRVDWLYSATGLSMEGDGVGLDGQRYHVEATGDGGWINAAGKRTKPGHSGWDRGAPIWRDGGYWLDARRRPTWPLAAGGWFGGVGQRFVAPNGISFGVGPSLPLVYYQSVAVDPKLIPLGSRIYIPAYRSIAPSHGWFTAADTGGAIIGRHVDVYRPPPASSADGGRYMRSQRIRVIPPGRHQ